MRKILAVAARELAERWILLPASLVVGFFPLVGPVSAIGFRREDAPFVGVVGAVGMGAAAAVVIGSSMLARDAADGRLGFLFSRPLPWRTIWGGKWLAAIVLVVSSGILAAIPWMAAFPLESLDAPPAGYLFVLIILGVGLANLGATAFRSRSKWLALDFALLLAAFWVVRRYVAPLWLYGIVGRGPSEVTLGLVAPAVSVVVASAAQVAVGRTDLRRAHRAMSLGFWAVIGLTVAAAAGYWLWVRSAGPDAVRVQAVTRDPAGRWIYVEGTGPHSGWYPHGHLIDTTSGRYLACPGPDSERERFRNGMLFSADGRFAALPHTDHDERGAALRLFDLTGDTPRLSEVALESSPPLTRGTSFALSPSAASVFMAHESGASLFELPSGRRVATTTIPPGWRPSVVRFLAEGAARAWLVSSSEGQGSIGPRAEVRVVDVSTDGATKAVTFPVAAALDQARRWGAVVADADGRRILTVDAGLHLRDGATGELVATLVEGAGRLSAVFLADGRIVVGDGPVGANETGLPRALMRFFDRSGARLGETRLELQPTGLGVGPELAPGRVAVSSFRAPFLVEDTLVVDVREGRIVERLPGLRPAIGLWDVSSWAPAGALVTSVHFFRDVEGRVLRIDFSSGERRVVAGLGAPAGERMAGP